MAILREFLVVFARSTNNQLAHLVAVIRELVFQEIAHYLKMAHLKVKKLFYAKKNLVSPLLDELYT